MLVIVIYNYVCKYTYFLLKGKEISKKVLLLLFF